MKTFKLEFITPLFSRGAYEDRPECRAASIRGQLHWWFRALDYSFQEEQEIFGSVHGKAIASKLVVRVQHGKLTEGAQPTLPHKSIPGHRAPRVAVLPGNIAKVHFLMRLGGLDTDLQAKLDRTIETWLMLGSLGLRATRGAGNFVWSGIPPETLRPPEDFEQYTSKCRTLLRGAPIYFDLLSKAYTSAENARRVVSDTIGGREDYEGIDSLGKLRNPLGKIGRTSRDRKTSPLRFRIVGIGNTFRIAAFWDGREVVTGNKRSDLEAVIALLAEKKPDLGTQLSHSSLLSRHDV